VLEHALGRDGRGVGEALPQRREPEEVVAVAVGDVDVGEAFVGEQGVDPVGEGGGLRGGEEGVDEDGFVGGGDEGGGCGGPEGGDGVGDRDGGMAGMAGARKTSARRGEDIVGLEGWCCCLNDGREQARVCMRKEETLLLIIIREDLQATRNPSFPLFLSFISIPRQILQPLTLHIRITQKPPRLTIHSRLQTPFRKKSPLIIINQKKSPRTQITESAGVQNEQNTHFSHT